MERSDDKVGPRGPTLSWGGAPGSKTGFYFILLATLERRAKPNIYTHWTVRLRRLCCHSRPMERSDDKVGPWGPTFSNSAQRHSTDLWNAQKPWSKHLCDGVHSFISRKHHVEGRS